MAQQELSVRYRGLLATDSRALFLQQTNSLVQQVPAQVPSTSELFSSGSPNTSFHDHGGRLLLSKHPIGFQRPFRLRSGQRGIDQTELEHACICQAADVTAEHALVFRHFGGQVGQSSQRNL